MKVQSILSSKGSEVVTIGVDTVVREAIHTICDKRIGAVVVLDDSKKIAGIFSERHLMREIDERGAAMLDLPVSSVMTTDVQTCSQFDTVLDVMALMTRRRFRHIPVIDNGDLIGLVSIGDAVKARIADAENEAEALKEYIATG